MERRFFFFILLSMAVLSVNGLLMRRLAPPARPEAKAELAAADDGDPDRRGVDALLPVDDDAHDEDDAAVAENDADADEGAPAEASADEPPLEYVFLGSVGDDSPFRLGVTLTNRGAAVRRLELSSPRYRDMHERNGYLGRLELEALAADGAGAAKRGGLKVLLVGRGTPADRAGLQIGDVIHGAGGQQVAPIESTAALNDMLDRTRPGSEFKLQIDRAGQTQTLTVKLTRPPAQLIRPESENYRLADRPLPAEVREIDVPSFELTLESLGERRLTGRRRELAGIRLARSNWQIVDRSDDAVTFEQRLPAEDLLIRKRYQIAKLDADAQDDPDAPAYHLTLEISVENRGQTSRPVAYRLDGPNGLPIEGWWYLTKSGRGSGLAGLRDVGGRYFGAEMQQQGASKIAGGDAADFEGASLAYMGVDSHYFCVSLIPQKNADDQTWTSAARPILVGPTPSKEQGLHFANVSCRLVSQARELEPNGTLTHRYQVFAGPKRPELLVRYAAAEDPAYTLRDYVYYGWFSGVARVLLGILHAFYGVVRNYGIAIIMLTVLVRGLMFPVSRGQARSMAKMQELKPELDKIKEKFKGDQQKQAQAMQQLYRKHHVNPLAGCLPMFLQLPVFIGLWRGLSVDVELRNAPLLGSLVRWCSNLAAPDMFWNWSALVPEFVERGQGMLGLGPYLNVLPLVTIGLFLLQQKMFMPPAATKEAEMQQSIMKWMSIFISIMFYKVPSGLCLYLITSSIWGIAERKLIPPATATPAPTGASTPAGPDASSKEEKPLGGLMARLQAAADASAQANKTARTDRAKRRK